MMVLPQQTNTHPHSHNHKNMLIMGLPKDLHKKRFHREKKMRMRRSQSLNDSTRTSLKAAVAVAPAPLSSDRWGNNAKLQPPPNQSLVNASTTKRTTKRDSQVRLPKRQRSFQNDSNKDLPPVAAIAPHKPARRRSSLVRSKSNVETMVDLIDKVLDQLNDVGSEF